MGYEKKRMKPRITPRFGNQKKDRGNCTYGKHVKGVQI